MNKSPGFNSMLTRFPYSNTLYQQGYTSKANLAEVIKYIMTTDETTTKRIHISEQY
jgi:hypothetical protein